MRRHATCYIRQKGNTEANTTCHVHQQCNMRRHTTCYIHEKCNTEANTTSHVHQKCNIRRHTTCYNIREKCNTEVNTTCHVHQKCNIRSHTTCRVHQKSNVQGHTSSSTFPAVSLGFTVFGEMFCVCDRVNFFLKFFHRGSHIPSSWMVHAGCIFIAGIHLSRT